jgi:hypothetical protein
MSYLYSRNSILLNIQTPIFRSRRTKATCGHEGQRVAEGVHNGEDKALYSNDNDQRMRSGAGGDATPFAAAT